MIRRFFSRAVFARDFLYFERKKKMKRNFVIKLTESAIMIAIATVLSLIKIIDLPYGGSVTIASMLPILIISYRNGIAFGLASGIVYGGIQQLLGLNTLSWVTGWQSVVAVILLDYIVAFAVIGLGGIFRKSVDRQPMALALGSLFVCVLRYFCHVISGATVWAGLSIPTASALIYSFAYNATYMVPETIVLLITTYYIGSVIDFREGRPKRLAEQSKTAFSPLRIAAGLCAVATLIFDIVCVFSKLQNADTGEWNITGLAQVNWMLVGIVTAVGALITAVLMIIGIGKKQSKTDR